jgi:hypothetical protein
MMIALAVVLAVWALFTWPLPRHAGSAIPSSAYNLEKDSLRQMIPGDHLQLLYQLWIGSDTLKGGTPWYHDVYEFNTGNDADRFFPSTYYWPFSFFFFMGSWFGGQAAGYNFAAFTTLFVTYLFTWLLIRRFTRDNWLSGVVAVISIIFPFRWITLLDGSPTGLTLMWTPVIFWALDIMIAEKKWWAGGLAGIGLFVGEWGDTHVFFFNILATPFWCVFCYLYHSPKWPTRKEALVLLKAAVLLIFLLGLVGFQVVRVKHQLKDATIAKQGRSIDEVANCSLPLSGVVKFVNPQDSRKIYMGGYLLLVMAGGWGAFLLVRRRDSGLSKRVLPLLLISGALFVIVMLATGTRNPLGPTAWKLLTMVVPPYGMIRQADKIFCLMPFFVAMVCGLLWGYILEFVPRERRRFWALALLVPLLVDYKYRIMPTLCGLDAEQGAYRAVAEDARAEGDRRPHIMVVPVWPGASHFNAVNEYYVSLYRIRMVNGYGGTVKTKYMENIFLPLESINMGGIYDPQLDNLLKRGIGYLVFHEDVFPEKVSPFPAGHTLQKLLNHPRLRCIGKDGAVWAFKIYAMPLPERAQVSFMTYLFAAKRRELERSVVTPAVVTKADSATLGEGYVTLQQPGDVVRIPGTLVPLDDPLQWIIHARGEGVLAVSHVVDGVTNRPVRLEVKSPDWVWVNVAIPVRPASLAVEGSLALAEGAVDLDSAILAGGTWASPVKGSFLDLPAACFFHAGATAADFEYVEFRKRYDPDAIVFYGPKLPLDKGKYSAEIIYESSAPAGTPLGAFNTRWPGDEDSPWVQMRVGSRAVATFEQRDGKPFFVAFRFFRQADMRIKKVRLSRLE